MEAGPSKRKKAMIEETTTSLEELKVEPSKRKKTMIEETTESQANLETLPVEILVKIFNFLPRSGHFCGPSSTYQMQFQGIFSGISLVCQKFQKICQDESLVPVRDLCILGQPVDWESYNPRTGKPNIGQEGKKRYMNETEDIKEIIKKSKNLTSLKIKYLNSECTNYLVSTAFRACPKLKHLEIIENSNEIGEYFYYETMFTLFLKDFWYVSIKISDLEHNYGLIKRIKKYGKNLLSIKLVIANETGFHLNFQTTYVLKYIAKGCPKLRSLTLESLRGWHETESLKGSLIERGIKYTYGEDPEAIKKAWKDLDMWDIEIDKKDLEEFSKGCKEFKDLKLAKIRFVEILAEDDIKKIFPNCNLEIKECAYDHPPEDDTSDADDE